MAIDQLQRDLDEERARIFGHVRARLTRRFPRAHPPAVDEAMQRAWNSLASARIRDFLEILVEREAAGLLGEHGSAPHPLLRG